MTLPAAIVALALAQAADGGVFMAQRATLEQLEGSIVALPALHDGGIVLVGLEPWKAMELADERRRKDWELARLRATPASTWVVVIGQMIATALNAVPLVIAITRQP